MEAAPSSLASSSSASSASSRPARPRRGTGPGLAWAVALALLVLLAAPGPAAAVGVGAQLGSREPDLALSLSDGRGARGFAAALAWGDGVYLHADSLLRLFPLGRRMPLYLGLGGRLRLQEETLVGLRVPLGLSVLFSALELFFEVVPQVQLYPALARDWTPVNLGVGVRLHFEP